MPSWNAPITLPLKFPLRMNEPVSDPPEAKQGVAVVKLRLVTVTTVLLFCIREVVNANTGVPLESDNAAVQFPVTLFELPELLEFPPPHPTSDRPSSRLAIPKYFMSIPSLNNLRLETTQLDGRQCPSVARPQEGRSALESTRNSHACFLQLGDTRIAGACISRRPERKSALRAAMPMVK
jgi:hypothetical protein